MCETMDLIGPFTKINIGTEFYVDFESQNGIVTGGTRTSTETLKPEPSFN